MSKPIVTTRPHGREFLADWTMGLGMIGSVDATVHEAADDAAIAAHSMADSDAEAMRYQGGEEQWMTTLHQRAKTQRRLP